MPGSDGLFDPTESQDPLVRHWRVPAYAAGGLVAYDSKGRKGREFRRNQRDDGAGGDCWRSGSGLRDEAGEIGGSH